MPEHLAVSLQDATAVELLGRQLAGKTVKGAATMALLALGDGVMLTHLSFATGFDQDGHTHDDHESIGYVLSGRIEMRIGDETRVLSAGDTWYHPRGVEHTSKALVDATALEFHAPLRADILKLVFPDR